MKVIIADDLTGANEIGLTLKKHGSNLAIVIDSKKIPKIKEIDSMVVDLETRKLNSKEAYEKTKEFLIRFENLREKIVYKKIDSTIRGNIAEELDPFLELNLAHIVILSPALPENGRMTIGGYHLVNGIPINRTAYAKDLRRPIGEAYLPDLIGKFSKYKVGLIELKDVLKGQKEILKQFKQSFRKGHKIIVTDVSSNRDLNEIAKAIEASQLNILPVGSSGLFEVLYPVKRSSQLEKVGKGEKPVLIICGSLNPISRSQIKMLIKKKSGETSAIELDLKTFLSSTEKTREEIINKLSEQGVPYLESGKNLVICTPEERLETNSGQQQITNAINTLLGQLTQKLVEKNPVSGLILTGGDTALTVINHLGVEYLKIKDQLVSYIPVSILRGNTYHGSNKFPYESLPVITKAGGFGPKDLLIKGVEYLR